MTIADSKISVLHIDMFAVPNVFSTPPRSIVCPMHPCTCIVFLRFFTRKKKLNYDCFFVRTSSSLTYVLIADRYYYRYYT